MGAAPSHGSRPDVLHLAAPAVLGAHADGTARRAGVVVVHRTALPGVRPVVAGGGPQRAHLRWVLPRARFLGTVTARS